MSDQDPEQPFFEMSGTDYTHFRVYYTTPNQPTCKDNPDHFPPPKVRPRNKKKTGYSVRYLRADRFPL